MSQPNLPWGALIRPLCILVSLMVGGSLISCSRGESVPPLAMNDALKADFELVASERVYFGHQSVGGNIINGVTSVLADHPEIPLQVFESTSLDSNSAPGLYHARIGQNGDPGSKTSAFESIVGRGGASVAALKFCYVDVDGHSDPDSLFAAYQRNMSALRARLPGLVIVHVTMPLTTTGEGRRDLLMAKLRGKATSYDLNLIRNRYNALLRQAYVGKEPVFDLARLESTHADGSRSYFTRGADTVYTLAPELTDDGGHLNTSARRAAAEAFLALLATL